MLVCGERHGHDTVCRDHTGRGCGFYHKQRVTASRNRGRTHTELEELGPKGRSGQSSILIETGMEAISPPRRGLFLSFSMRAWGN